MNEQQNQEPNTQQTEIEDLTVNEDQSADVKGGIAFVGGWGSSMYQYSSGH